MAIIPAGVSSARFVLRALVVPFALLQLTACAATPTYLLKAGTQRPAHARVLLMPIDVELYELTGGGLLEPKAEWTATAGGQVLAKIRQRVESHRHEAVGYRLPPGETAVPPEDVQLAKLHHTTILTILTHAYDERARLPTKPAPLDYNLGAGTAAWRRRFDADYALFASIRASAPSPDRASAAVSFAIRGRYLSTGHSFMVASLIDLRSGEVVWCHRLSAISAVDLRDSAQLGTVVHRLLEGLPL
jgi:hypothetical protein